MQAADLEWLISTDLEAQAQLVAHQVQGNIDFESLQENEHEHFTGAVDAGRVPGVSQLAASSSDVEPLRRSRK